MPAFHWKPDASRVQIYKGTVGVTHANVDEGSGNVLCILDPCTSQHCFRSQPCVVGSSSSSSSSSDSWLVIALARHCEPVMTIANGIANLRHPSAKLLLDRSEPNPLQTPACPATLRQQCASFGLATRTCCNETRTAAADRQSTCSIATLE